MNERIRELAEQALFESDFDDEQNIKITMDIFAELIVRECMKVSNLSLSKYELPSDKLAEHFGVRS